MRKGAKGISLFIFKIGNEFLNPRPFKIIAQSDTKIKNAVPIQNEYKNTDIKETIGENAGA